LSCSVAARWSKHGVLYAGPNGRGEPAREPVSRDASSYADQLERPLGLDCRPDGTIALLDGDGPDPAAELLAALGVDPPALRKLLPPPPANAA
jgi:hypothetical protein